MKMKLLLWHWQLTDTQQTTILSLGFCCTIPVNFFVAKKGKHKTKKGKQEKNKSRDGVQKYLFKMRQIKETMRNDNITTQLEVELYIGQNSYI